MSRQRRAWWSTALRAGIPFGVVMGIFNGMQSGAHLGAAGGWLFLTKQRLVFVPHKINLSTKRLEVPRGDIVESKAARAYRMYKLEVVTKDGSHKFAVDPRDNWKQAIARAGLPDRAAAR